MDGSNYFRRTEFACKCGCGYDTVDADLLHILHRLRRDSGKAVYINSGCRCDDHNSSIGGSVRSQHLLGKAADIRVAGVDTKKIYQYIDLMRPNDAGIGLYKTFVHVDVRAKKARWGYGKFK